MSKTIKIIISNIVDWRQKWFLFVQEIYIYLLKEEPEKMKDWILSYCASILGVLEIVKKWDYDFYNNIKRALIEKLSNE
jgi:hypothetical protein